MEFFQFSPVSKTVLQGISNEISFTFEFQWEGSQSYQNIQYNMFASVYPFSLSSLTLSHMGSGKMLLDWGGALHPASCSDVIALKNGLK